MFDFEIAKGELRPAVVVRHGESHSEIIVFLSVSDRPVSDMTGALTHTPHLMVDNDVIVKDATAVKPQADFVPVKLDEKKK